jgi:creatinine amidohydrolase
LHNAVFFSSPGSVYRMTKSGTWGDATQGTAEKGEEILEAGVQSVINLMADYEKTIEGLEVR